VNNASGIPILFFALLVMALLAVAVFALNQYQQSHQLLERIANRFRGRLEPGDFLTSPQVRLKFQGYPALLKYVRVGKNRWQTVFTITWPDPDLRCEIYPQDIFAGFRRLWGMEDILIGSRQFDDAYFICGTNKAAIRDLLTSEVQTIIFRLAALSFANYFATHEIQVRWSGGVLSIAKPSRLSTYESLEQFLSLCGVLFEAALRTRSTGIEFVSESVREPDTAESQCQVCGETLERDLVYCDSCETPHHRECWLYFGGCSTYACGQKKFIERPKPKKRKPAKK
jgi:hypothetical protein